MRNMNIKTAIYSTVIILLSSCGQIKAPHQDESITMVEKPVLGNSTSNYVNNRLPLLPQHFIKLPVGSIQPEGWLKEYLIRQRDGLTGHLNEISAWLEKNNNAWLTTQGDHGWEEVPYCLCPRQPRLHDGSHVPLWRLSFHIPLQSMGTTAL